MKNTATLGPRAKAAHFTRAILDTSPDVQRAVAAVLALDDPRLALAFLAAVADAPLAERRHLAEILLAPVLSEGEAAALRALGERDEFL